MNRPRSSFLDPQASLRVLVVDDDLDDIEFFADALERADWSFEIDAVGDSTAARDLIKTGRYDVFLIDSRLGTESGMDLIAELASDASGPMIAVTGRHHSEVDRAAQAAGAFDYLPKDQATPEVLSRTIRYAVKAWQDRNRYYKLFDQAPVGLFRTLPDGTIVEANPELEAILGKPLPGENARDFYVDPADRARTIEALRSSDDLADLEFEMQRDDGSHIWVSIRYRGEYVGGELVGLYGTVRDVTEARRIDEERRLHSAMLDDVQHAVAAVDMDGRISFWNRRAEQELGWSSHEVIGRSLGELGLFGTVDVPLLSSTSNEQNSIAESDVFTKSGGSFPAVVNTSVVIGAEGEPTAVVCAIVDLSEIREAQKRAETRQAMAESVLNSVAFPATIIDGSGVIIAVNRTWTAQALEHGADLSEVGIGVNYLDVCNRSSHPDAHTVANGIRSVLNRRSTGFSMEYECHSFDEQRWFQLQVSPAEHPVDGAVLLHLDVTPLHQAAARAQQLANSRIGLLASVSHELRTPLTAVLGFASLCETVDPAEAVQFAVTIKEQAADMSEIIEDLLVASRYETGQVTLAPRCVDLDELAHRTVNSIVNTHGKTIEVAAGSAQAFADPLRARQIMRNLLTNAVRYGGERITIATSSNGETSRISITDDGSGISDERMSEIFVPFENAHPHEGRPDSIGIGLSVARTLAEAMDGDLIYRRSDAGETVFDVTLPTPHA